MVTIDDVVEITQNILATMLVVEAIFTSVPQASGSESEMIGCIQISGTWCGSVLVRTSEAFVTSAASKMLMMAPDIVVLADRQDTLAELTNLIGGNIKSVVPSPSSLSLPTVSTGSELSVRLVGSKTIHSTCFKCESHELFVTVYEGLPRS